VSSTRIKICGLTTPEDATLAVSLGADFVGVIFAESARRVDMARAVAIRAAVPSAVLVGVFRNPTIEDVVEAALQADLDILQFHGHESPAFCDEALTRTGKPLIKVFDASQAPSVPLLAAYTTTSYFLIDANKDEPHPSNARFTQAADIRGLGFRVFLAGGLTPDNVHDAVRSTRPFAVDVCRGVERTPGHKDPEAMERFIAEVRR
jgi:phosphoribosylanthranilate isomerase